MSSTAISLDPETAATIARAEARRGMLEQMSRSGMELVEIVVESARTPEPAGESLRDPFRAFAQVTRAVRLTLGQETRIDEKLLAIRNGKPPVREPAAPRSTAGAPQAEPAAQILKPDLRRDSPDPRRNRARDVVWEAIDREVRDSYDAHWMLDQVHERLIEGEAYDTLIDGDFRACIATICADLGLNPDWSRWSDEVGFIRQPEEAFFNWSRRYSYNPETAQIYARRRIERREGVQALSRALANGELEPHRRQ